MLLKIFFTGLRMFSKLSQVILQCVIFLVAQKGIKRQFYKHIQEGMKKIKRTEFYKEEYLPLDVLYEDLRPRDLPGEVPRLSSPTSAKTNTYITTCRNITKAHFHQDVILKTDHRLKTDKHIILVKTKYM